MKKILILTLLIIILSSCDKMKAQYPQVGKPLPTFCITDNNGNTITTDTLSKGTSVITFFNTKCTDCKEELPIVDSLFRTLNNTAKFIAISRDECFNDVKQYWLEKGLTVPFSAQTDRKIYNLFTDCGIPHLVISKEGIIKKIHNAYKDGVLPKYEQLKEEIQNPKL